MRKKVLASLSLAAAMIATTMPAMAATPVEGGHGFDTHPGVTPADVCEEQTIDRDESAQCDVYAKVGSTFTVTIPKKITLAGATKTGSYTVSCTGDIAGNEYVSVTPDNSFMMKQTGKNDVTTIVSQAVNKFRGNNYVKSLNVDGTEAKMQDGATGAIYADGSNGSGTLTAGAWNGTFNFAIALNTDSAN